MNFVIADKFIAWNALLTFQRLCKYEFHIITTKYILIANRFYAPNEKIKPETQQLNEDRAKKKGDAKQ